MQDVEVEVVDEHMAILEARRDPPPVGRNNHVRVGGEAIWRTWQDLR
jgi:hypothetical protein